MTALPQHVVDLLAAAFPGQRLGEIGPTAGGFSNITARATIGGRRCVVKAAALPLKRADVRHEARVLALLRDRGLPAPAPLALVEDATWTVAATEFVPGELGLQLLARDPTELGDVFFALGRALAQVHATPRLEADPTLELAARARHALDLLPGLGLGTEHGELLAASLAHPAWRAGERLVHGDAGLHNLLWNGRITALLDWEWSGFGNPLLDLAWLQWTMRWRDLPAELWDRFLSGYGKGLAGRVSATPEDARALVYGQIASILARVHEQPAARAEWLRRLEWTRGIWGEN